MLILQRLERVARLVLIVPPAAGNTQRRVSVITLHADKPSEMQKQLALCLPSALGTQALWLLEVA